MSQLFGPSWRTTISGLVLVAIGAALLLYAQPDKPEAIATAAGLITAGIGLCTAKDH